MSLPAKKIIDANETDNTDYHGRLSLRNAQHSQSGPSLSDNNLNLSGQLDCNQFPPELSDETLDLQQKIKLIRDRQQYDLAMLRHAFRNFLIKKDNDNDTNPDLDTNENPFRNVSSSELNQLVSAVVRLHDDERELLGIKPPDIQDDEDEEYKHLEQLSVPQLIELCYKEGIAPPSPYKTKNEEKNSNNISQKRPLDISD